ncbi:MAG: decaprenyl-phosphate phosphoribosyltransferase [Chloroflexi bacterium]|nr:decaprenyl-phosphate phosphoribosyltransferase [Chloroflexota bacterium]|tara:strand:- start:70846 stop:71802 length:957 start_codon:yes stop_codon:yes gene_type:complete
MYIKILAVIQTLRIRQSLKNLLVLVPLFFTINIWFSLEDLSGMLSILLKAIYTMLGFFLLSASVYLLNDSIDINNDKKHPFKKHRPIPKGDLSIFSARIWAITFCLLGNLICYLTNPLLLSISISFTILNICYCIILKNIVIIDVITIAIGFILRAVAGSIAINQSKILINGNIETLELSVSSWLYVVTGLGALFIALSKRRGELLGMKNNVNSTRKTLEQYTIPFLDNLINIVATATLFAYTLYSFSYLSPNNNLPSNNSMMLTIPFVYYGIFRYLYLIQKKQIGEKPEEIFVNDLPLLANIILWLITSSLILLYAR